MNRSKPRLILAALLLIGWIGWLGYLARTKTTVAVISRSQLMVSSHFVLAEVQVDPQTGQPDRLVTVVEDLRSGDKPVTGKITVTNLRNARLPMNSSFQPGEQYLLPLTIVGEGQFELTVQPQSPGQEVIKEQNIRPWAYPWSIPSVRTQFDQLIPRKS